MIYTLRNVKRYGKYVFVDGKYIRNTVHADCRMGYVVRLAVDENNHFVVNEHGDAIKREVIWGRVEVRKKYYAV